jgi:hypothetical protein
LASKSGSVAIGEKNTSKGRIARVLTLVYFIAAIPISALSVHDNSWFGVAWMGAVILFVLPVTLILWVIVFIDLRVLQSRLSAYGVAGIGVLLPVIYVLLIYAIPKSRQERATRRTLDEGSAAIVESIRDEPLMIAEGLIGVRLRYTVTYPKGLEMDAAEAPTTYVRTLDGNGKDLIFLLRNRAVAPTVSNWFPPGTYAITDDFLPAFLPASLLPLTGTTRTPTGEGRPLDLPANCFRWMSWQQRPEIEKAVARQFTISIFPGLAAGDPAKSTITSQTYSLKEFLTTADKEGAIDCGLTHKRSVLR